MIPVTHYDIDQQLNDQCEERDDLQPAIFLETTARRIQEIRNMIVKEHCDCHCTKGCGGSFGEVFCGHIHADSPERAAGLTFKQQAEHYGITMHELAAITADHILRL